MIDIHSHILPGVDDGAQTLEDSIKMARLAVEEGIQKIVATPHHKTSTWENAKPVVIEKIRQLNEALHQEGIPLEVLPGQEVRIFGEIVEDYRNGEIVTVNGSQYVLIEFPSNHIPSYSERLFYELQMHGLIPIIVHPERNSAIVEEPDKLYHLIEKGALSQVTAGSVTGALGKKLQKFSFQLIEANLTHFIAGDAHSTTTRPFKMAEAYHVLEKQYGIDLVYQFRENAQYVIDNKTIYRESPNQIKRKKLLGLF